MFGAIVGSSLWQDLIATVGGAVLIFLIDRGARAVSAAFVDRQEREEQIEHMSHRVDVWALGLPATDDRPAVPGFMTDIWPKHVAREKEWRDEAMERITTIEEAVLHELKPNSGSSVVDRIDKIMKHLGIDDDAQ